MHSIQVGTAGKNEIILQLCRAAGFETGEMNNNPENRQQAETDDRLAAALGKIPNAAVPSNFTARVLAALEIEEARVARARGWALNWHLLWPRVAVAAAILIFAAMTFQRYETISRRSTLARNVATLAGAQPPPSVDALENLDAIQRMSQPAPADGELLAVLQ